MPAKTLTAEDLARLAKTKAENTAANEEARSSAEQIRRLKKQILAARSIAKLVHEANTSTNRSEVKIDALQKKFLRVYNKLPQTVAEMAISKTKMPNPLSIRYADLTKAKYALESFYTERAAASKREALGKGISRAMGGIGQAASTQQAALGKGISHLFDEISKAAGMQKAAIGKGLNNLFGGIGKAAILQQKQTAALGAGVSRSMVAISRAAALQQKQAEALGAGVSRSMVAISRAAALQQKQAAQQQKQAAYHQKQIDEANILSRHPGHAILDFFGGVGVATTLHPMSIMRHLVAHIKKIRAGYRGGGGIFGRGGGSAGGGGGFGGGMATAGAIGASGLDALTLLGLGGAVLAGGAYAAYKGIQPGYRSLEAVARAGRISGLTTTQMASLYGGGNVASISPRLARLGIGTPADYANIIANYGLPYGAGNVGYMSAVASQSKYMGFMEAPEWSKYASSLMGGGYSFKEAFRTINTDMVDMITRGVKYGVDESTTFKGFESVRHAMMSGNYLMPPDQLAAFYGRGIGSSIPSMRTGAAQTQALGYYSQSLANLPFNPVQANIMLSELHRTTGSTVPTWANLSKMAKHYGLNLSTSAPMGLRKAITTAAKGSRPWFAMNLAFSSGMLNPELFPMMEYKGLRHAGLPVDVATSYMLHGMPMAARGEFLSRIFGAGKAGGGKGGLSSDMLNYLIKYAAPGELTKAFSGKNAWMMGKLSPMNIEQFELDKTRLINSNMEIAALETSTATLIEFNRQLLHVTNGLKGLGATAYNAASPDAVSSLYDSIVNAFAMFGGGMAGIGGAPSVGGFGGSTYKSPTAKKVP